MGTEPDKLAVGVQAEEGRDSLAVARSRQ